MNYKQFNAKRCATVAALLCATVGAQAQSNVAVYGLIDLAVVKESGSSARVDRGYMNWLGFTGSEDLGGGNAATFNLMTRFLANNGSNESSTFWHGETTVGLKNQALGAVRLGRGLTPMFASKYQFEPWGDSWMTGSLGKYQATGRYFANPVACLSDCPGFGRLNGAVFYDSPAWNGFSVHLASQVSKEPGTSRRGTGVTLSYAQGRAKAMLSWEQNTTNATAIFAAGSYDFGAAVVMGSVGQSHQDGTPNQTSVVLGAVAPVQGGLSFRAGYGRNTDTHDDKLSAGPQYALSKRTQLYADVYHERGSAKMNGFALGMQHSF